MGIFEQRRRRQTYYLFIIRQGNTNNTSSKTRLYFDLGIFMNKEDRAS